MSEYQYYEFQAIDKPLDEKGIQALENLSSRARITPTSFVNEYNWGDFKGNPLKLMEKYFDAFLYVANWGTHRLMLRVPLRLINFDLAKKYCLGENATAYKKGENLIFEFISDTDDYEWEEGEGRLSSLISLRSDIIRGDYRCLYLAMRRLKALLTLCESTPTLLLLQQKTALPKTGRLNIKMS
jgi:hypothetical protein